MLFRRLEELAQNSSGVLCSISLYPGLDRYDLQLSFSDGVIWAIDVKDYRNPYKLALKLSPLYSEGRLKYAEGFYVVSDSRVKPYTDYMQIVREKAKLPANIHVVDNLEFDSWVVTKIDNLKPEGRTNESR